MMDMRVATQSLLFLLLFIISSAQAKEQTLYALYGDTQYDRFGHYVNAAGDVNNDGYADFIVQSQNGGYRPVMSGKDGSVLYQFGDNNYVSSVGDVNNDGYTDLISGGGWSGADVYSGVDGAVLYHIPGGSAYFGQLKSSAEDVNKDGYSDVIIRNGSEVDVFSGVDGSMLYTFSGNVGSNFGSSLDSAGDVNNDGYTDVIVGADGGDYAEVFSGIDGSSLYVFYGNDESLFGSSVSGAGDINNDGYADVIVGANRDYISGAVRGSAQVFSGIDGGVIYAFSGDDANDRLGFSVSGAGDVNNDGYADVIVGASGDDNNGDRSGSARVYSGATGETLYAFNGISAIDAFGNSVSGAGDVDGDGYADLIVGAYKNDTNAIDGGAVYIFSGKKLFSTKDDFTNNGVAGWIWKGEFNGHEGYMRTWSADWSTVTPGWVIPTRTWPPYWAEAMDYDIETTGDFDGDGDADWLWRGRSDDRWKIWEMENGTRVGQTTPPDFDAGHNWTVVGAGDADKDGDDDVILNNTSTGEISIWQMHNNVIMNTHSVGAKASYEVVRVGDFDGDYDMDLLLQASGGNGLLFWEIENNAFVAEHATPQTGSGFVTQCAGDFNGDGNDDVYLLAADGTSKWFEYVDFVRQQQKFGANQSAWRFKGCADYDGDGDSDILWSSDDGWGFNRIFLNQNFNNSATYYTNRYAGDFNTVPGYGFEYRGNNN